MRQDQGHDWVERDLQRIQTNDCIDQTFEDSVVGEGGGNGKTSHITIESVVPCPDLTYLNLARGDAVSRSRSCPFAKGEGVEAVLPFVTR